MHQHHRDAVLDRPAQKPEGRHHWRWRIPSQITPATLRKGLSLSMMAPCDLARLSPPSMGAWRCLCGAFAAHGLAGAPGCASLVGVRHRRALSHVSRPGDGLGAFAMRGPRRPARRRPSCFWSASSCSPARFISGSDRHDGVGFCHAPWRSVLPGGWGALAWAASRLP